MQIVCESCGETSEAADVRVEGGAVVVTCGACGAESTLGGGRDADPDREVVADAAPDNDRADGEEPRDAETSADDPAAPAVVAPSASEGETGPSAELPPVKCPKCGHRQHDPKACHKCGLVFALAADGRRPWETPPPGKEEAVARATELWTSVELRHEDEDAHVAFYEHCRANGIPGWAAMRYRHWLADRPDDELARRYRDRAVADAQIVAQAMIKGEAERFARVAGRVRNLLLWIVVVLLVIATVVMVRMFQRGQQFQF